MHLVDYFYETYHDARSPEHKARLSHRMGTKFQVASYRSVIIYSHHKGHFFLKKVTKNNAAS